MQQNPVVDKQRWKKPVPAPRRSSYTPTSTSSNTVPTHEHNAKDLLIATPRHRKEKPPIDKSELLNVILGIQNDQCKVHDAMLNLLKST